MELSQRQEKATRAYERGDQTYKAHAREQLGILDESDRLKRKYTDELAVGEIGADKDAGFLVDLMGAIDLEASQFKPAVKTIFSPFLEKMGQLESAFAQGVIDADSFHGQMDSLNKSYLDVAVANLDLIKTDEGLIKQLEELHNATLDSVKYMHPVNKGVRGFAASLDNVMLAQKAGYLTGDKLAESYVAINDQARDFRAGNTKYMQQNPKLLKQLNDVIAKTDGWRKKLEEIPAPEGPAEKFASFLGFGPKEGMTPEQKQQAQADLGTATGLLEQAPGQAIDRVYNEGTQGRDFGPAGDIGADFAKNAVTMGPEIAALKAALDVLIEIFVQAADMANLFGEGLQMFFDPLNKLITIIADTLSPVFNILGNVFANVGQVLGGFVSILRPIFKVVKSVFQVIQAITTPFKVLANVVGLVMKAIGVLYQKALKPLSDFFNNLARTIVSMINRVIDVINSLIPGKRWDLDYVSLEGKRHVTPEEEEAMKDKDKEKDDKADKQRAKMLAELR